MLSICQQNRMSSLEVIVGDAIEEENYTVVVKQVNDESESLQD